MLKNCFIPICLLAIYVTILTACGRGNAPEAPIFDLEHLGDLSAGVNHVELGWTGLDFNHEGQVTLAFWGLGSPGELIYVRDLGNTNPGREDRALMTRNTASVMAAARLFNAYFPNVTINAQSSEFSNNSIVPHAREAFHQEHGYHIDTWMTTNLVNEILSGNIMDLSLFADDPVLDLMNPTIMRMFMHLDRLWALPMLTSPSGVFVNYSLADNLGIDVPPIDWTMEEFVSFVAHSERDVFYGIFGVPWTIMNTMTQDFYYQMLFRQPDEPFVRIDTPAMRAVNAMVPQIVHHTVLGNIQTRNISAPFLDQYGISMLSSADIGWSATIPTRFMGWSMFAQGVILAHHDQDRKMSVAGAQGNANRVQALEWDYFPRPSTQWVGNHVGTMIDVMPIRNVAMDDGDPLLNWDEYNQLRLIWEFLRFYTIDLRSWQARSDMLWGPYNQSAKTESLPFTVGQLFYDMLDIHLQAPERHIFADVRQFPAYHYVMQLWEEGAVWGLWHTVYLRSSMIQWDARFEVGRVNYTSPEWYERLLTHLPAWDVVINENNQGIQDLMMERIQRFNPPQRRLSQQEL